MMDTDWMETYVKIVIGFLLVCLIAIIFGTVMITKSCVKKQIEKERVDKVSE